MNKNYLVEAIRFFLPNAEFTFENDDYSTVKWITEVESVPTKTEINKKIDELVKNDLEFEKSKVQRKIELLNRLGITEEEAKLLLS